MKKNDEPCHNNEEEGTGKRKQSTITDTMQVKKKRFNNRFNGLSEDEVMKMGLPDYLKDGLDIVFVGINPGLAAAYAGTYYYGPGNHFWKCLYLSGLIDSELTSKDDYKLLDLGIGFTNMVSRTTKGSNDLSKLELVEGGKILAEKMKIYKPRIVVFNGKISYEAFAGKKKFHFGLQGFVEGTNTYIWVMPSSSARCAQLPRAEDKVPFFLSLKNLCQKLKENAKFEEKDFVFSNLTLKGFPRKSEA